MTTTLLSQVQMVRERWLAELGPAASLYLIVNPAALHASDLDVPRLAWSCRGLSLVDEDLVEQPDVKPFLMALTSAGAEDALEWWCEHGRRIHGLTVLASMLDLHELAAALRTRPIVTLEPGLRMSLRLYDTRVAPIAYQALAPRQRTAMFAGILRWAYADRDGQLAELPAPLADANTLPEPLPIRLAPAQEDLLIRSSQADQLLPYLGEDARTKIGRRRTAAELNTLLLQLIANAMSHGLDGLNAWVAYCNAWAQQGPNADADTEWIQRLGASVHLQN